MSHRTADAERVRRAHASRLDPETADRVMNREWRSATPRRGVPEDDRTARALMPEHAASPDASEPSESPAHVLDRLAHDAVMPDALAVACAEHDAAPGVYCYRGARGVCRDRLDRRHRDV